MTSKKITAADRILLLALFCIALTTNCFAAIAWEKAREHPDFPGQCLWGGKIGSFNPDDVSVYPEGTSWDIGDCVRATCASINDELYIQYASCGVIGVEPRCIIVPGNHSLSYPDCCPRGWCPDLPPPRTDDPLLSTNQIEKDSEETDELYSVAL